MRVVVLQQVNRRREPAIVVEAAPGVSPETLERRRAVAGVRSAVRLEVSVKSGGTWRSEHRARPANSILPRAAAPRIEAVVGWGRRVDGELVEVQSTEPWGDEVRIVPDVAVPVPGADGEASGVVEPWVEEGSLPVHLEIGDEGVPVRDRIPAGPGVLILAFPRLEDAPKGAGVLSTKQQLARRRTESRLPRHAELLEALQDERHPPHDTVRRWVSDTLNPMGSTSTGRTRRCGDCVRLRSEQGCSR